MATKSYSKHKEYKEYSTSSGNIPYTDEQLDMIKTDLIPKGCKLDSLGRSGGGKREYHYEYEEEKLPSGKYDRKDLHSVEEFTIPPKSHPKTAESSTYYYEREERELPALGSSGVRTYNYETTGPTPGYSRVKTSKVTKDLSQNVEELDSLLDDLQKDQERQLYKNGYSSDTAESTSFDYKRGYGSTPIKAPSSGYSTLKREERVESSSWGSSPPPPPALTRAAEVRQEVYREEKTESRVVPAQVSPARPLAVPAPLCAHCHQPPSTGTLTRSGTGTGTPMNKVTTTVKTYTYEVPADSDPARLPIPPHAEQHSYVSSNENVRTTSTSGPAPAPLQASPPPPGACQHCQHCNSHVREYRSVSTSDDRTIERMVHPSPANETKLLPSEPLNGHGPYGPTTYKYSETSYSSQNSSQRYPRGSPSPLPPHSPPYSTTLYPANSPSPGPFPRPSTPSAGTQQPPKKLDDLLAEFPEARFPTQADGVVRRKVDVTHESSRSSQRDATPATPATKPTLPVGGSRNVAGPAVYYPPGHTPFAKKDQPLVAAGGAGYQSSAMQGGGAYASGRGMYEYESGSRMKEKHSERKTAVPICLPLCCAMPCVIM